MKNKPVGKKGKKWFIIVGILIISGALMGVLLTIREERNTPIRDQTLNMGEVRDWSLEQRTNLIGDNISFFDTMEDSLQHFHDQEIDNLSSLPLSSEQIISFEKDSYIFAVFPTRHWQGDTLIDLFLFEVRANQISYPLYAWVEGVERSSIVLDGIWYDEDRIARDLISAYVVREVTLKVNNGIPIYYGVGIGFPPQQISILGYEPDNIIHFEYDEEDYFFWYYLANPEFGDLISEYIDLSSKTLGEIIELFDIQVIR